jgi:hypothetical protein
MAKQEALAIEGVEKKSESEVSIEEKSLVVLDYKPKKKIDETISTAEKYVSRYHYDTRQIDAEMELCPHCQKPTISAFQRTVVDSAMNYLMEKEDLKDRRHGRRRNITLLAGGMLFLAGLYFWVFHIISGARV